MIPSAFVTCESFPLTANGKIDRKTLLEIEFIPYLPSETSPKPKTEIELKLIQIWSEVLNLETVEINSNFFGLGGDSILAIQIIAKANQAGLQLSPKHLFQHQSIAELASVVGTNTSIQAEQGMVTGKVAFTPIQHWFFSENLPQANHYNQSLLL